MLGQHLWLIDFTLNCSKLEIDKTTRRKLLACKGTLDRRTLKSEDAGVEGNIEDYKNNWKQWLDMKSIDRIFFSFGANSFTHLFRKASKVTCLELKFSIRLSLELRGAECRRNSFTKGQISCS